MEPRNPDRAAPAVPPLTDEVAQALDAGTVAEIRALRDDFARFMLQYKFGMDEIVTKVTILQEEFREMREYNPIEHVSSRLKSADSLIEKIERKGCDTSFEGIAGAITDIAGVRITCSFVSDVYRVFDMLTSQADVRVLEVKDYIATPKENGYKSLHAIVEVPVFLSGGSVDVCVEVQFRTIAMDFWASLEHKIYYKYDRQVPQQLLDGLSDAARTAAALDADMERLHRQVRGELPLDPVLRILDV